MAKHYTLSVYNLSDERLCTLYDSDVEQDGTAYNIEISKELNGWKEVSFSLPKQLNNGEKNYRIDFIRNEHLLYLYEDDERDVYCIKEPAHIHDSKSLVVNVQANHLSEELKSKNLYRSFTDENGVDTCDNLIRKAIAGTGWTLGTYDTFYENTGETEKVRSYTCSEKTGAYAMITGICALFEAHPVFHGRTRTIDIRANDNSTGYMEINFGKNMDKISRTLDSSNLITRLYVEGEYSDVGYVGIETVNPTGLPFILNFDYYKELGVFTPEHQAAIDAYIAAYQRITSTINTSTTAWIEKSGQLIGHIGNAGYVYCPIISGVIQTNSKIYSSDIPESERTYNDGDDVCLFRADGSYDHYEYSSRTWGGYTAIVKFYPVLTGTMAVREDNITVNSNYVTTTLASLNTYLTNGGYPTVTVASLKTTYNTQDLRQVKNDDFPVSSLPEQYQDSNVRSYVSDIGRGDYQVTTTTADLITEGAEVISLIQQVHILKNTVSSGEQELNDAEAAFNLAMGVLLKDGYWSNNNYVPGQEQELYNDALVMSRKIGYPVVSYTVSVKDLSIKPEYADERMEIGYEVRMYDDVMGINDYAFVNQTKDHPDNPAANSLVIKTDLEDIGSKSFSSIIERITDLADQLKDEQDIYKRARIIDDDGKIDTSFLEGAINILTQKLSSASSNWETDANGNIIFTSLDGNGAMQLCGYGFMIASEKNPDGSWRWRTFGTGEGFTADLITAGFIQADRIAAHSITVNHLASDVGSSLDLSSNVAITSTVQDLNDLSDTVSQVSQTADEIVARVGNMRIGAENLVWTGDAHLSYTAVNEIMRSGFTPTTYTRGGVIFRLNPPEGGFTSSNWSVINLKDILMSGSSDAPEKLTLSFYAWTQNIVGAQPKLSLLMYRPASTGVESVTQAVVSNLQPPANAPGARKEYSFELPYSGSFYLQLLLHGNANSFTAGSVYVSDIMLERGTMATDYGMNPEETNDRLKYAEIKITDDSIVQTVVNGINSSTSTQLADAIINKVTGSEQYEEDLGNKVNVSTFTQEMGQITARVTSIESEEVTGINLAAISQQRFGGSTGGDISGDNVINNTTQYYYSMSQKIFRVSGAYTGDYNILAFNNVYVRAGLEYVLTYYSRVDSATGGYPGLRIDLYNSDNQQYIDGGGYQYLSTDTTYRKYTYKFTATYTGTFALRFLFFSTRRNGWSGGYINFSDVMLEEGNVSTPWTPNPYDVDARISSAEVKITPQAITQTVTQSQTYINDLGSKASVESVSTLETAVGGITGRVTSLEGRQVGVANIAAISNQRWAVSSGGTMNHDTFENNVQYYYSMSQKVFRFNGTWTGDYTILAFNNCYLRGGVDYTLSYYTRVDTVTGGYPTMRIDIWNSDNQQYLDNGGYTYTSAMSNYAKHTWHFTCNTAGTYALRFLFFNSQRHGWNGGRINFSDVMLVEGNVITPWAPSPYDMDSRLASAEVKITPNAIVSTVTQSQTYVNDLGGKADNSTVNGINQRLISAESTITQTPTMIEQAVNSVVIGCDNLVRYADGTVTVTTGTISTFSSDAWYRKGGKEFRMLPFTGQNNIIRFLSQMPFRSGATYTLSFYAWRYNISSAVTLTAQILGTDTNNADFNFGNSFSLTTSPQKFTYTFTSNKTADASGARVVFSTTSTFSGSSSWITICDVKFEEGNKATDWTPHREEMKAGSTVTITKDEVNISTPAFVVDIGSDDNPDLLLDDTGATFKRVSSPNVAEEYTGEGYTYNSATNTVEITVPTEGSLQTILGELSGKYLSRNVTITLTNNDTSNGSITLRGVVGGGNITIKGPKTNVSTGGYIVKKPVAVSSVTAPVVFEDLTFNYQSATIANLTNDSFVRFTRCVFNAGSGTSILVMLNNGTRATLYQCQLLSPSASNPTGATLMQANYNTDLLIYSCKGGTNRYFLSGNGGNIKIYGSRPAGSYTYLAPSLLAPADPNSVTVDSEGFSGGTPVPAPPADPTTVSYSLASKGSYGGGSWNSSYLRDGILNGVSYMGSMWFNAYALKGKTIQSASLTLKRNSAGADTSNVRLKVTAQTASSHSGSPDEHPVSGADFGKIGSVRRGKTATIDIPAAAITSMIPSSATSNANLYALTLYVNDTEQMSGKTYSANYASFDEATLTVTYT